MYTISEKDVYGQDQKLPEVNPRREKATEMEWKLKTAIHQAIIKFEEENGYKFEPYERDHVLLYLIQDNHKAYLNSKFGHHTL